LKLGELKENLSLRDCRVTSKKFLSI